MAQQGWTDTDALDLDNVPDEPPGPPDDGVYNAEITKAEPEATKEGKPAIGLEFRLLTDHTGSESSLEGKSRNIRFVKISFAPEALFRLKNLCKSLGVDAPKSKAVDVVREWCESVVGMSVWLRTKQRPRFNDKTKRDANIDRYFTEEQAQAAANGAEADASGTASSGDAASAAGRRKRRTG